MDTKDSQTIFEEAKRCYENEYWKDALRHIDELSCEMTENKEVMFMRALCLARIGNVEASELLCDQLIVVYQDPRGKKLKSQLQTAKRDEKEKPKVKQQIQIPTFLIPTICIAVVVIVGLGYGIKTIKNYVPEAVASATAPAEERVLDFGSTGLPGMLYTRAWQYDLALPVQGDNFWRELGRAIGEVTLPLGTDLRLDLTDASQVDFSLLRKFGPGDLQTLDLERAIVSVEDLEYVARLSGLRELSLSDTAVTSAGFAKLRRLTSLWSLSISGIMLSDQGWAIVHSMPYIRQIVLDRGDVNDERLATLCTTAPLLKSISLDENPQLTDTGIVEIEKLKSLEHLFLSYTGITDEGLARLQNLNNLERIYLEGTAVTDACVAGFRTMPSITFISLSRTQITDAAIEDLKKMNTLRKLDISACPFLTEAAIESLRQALPGCEIDITGNVTDRPAMWNEPV